jgi:hypothetical protein
VVHSYVAQVLRPTLRPGNIVIMHNLRAHQTAGIHEAIEQAGARLLYLPPYPPDPLACLACRLPCGVISCIHPGHPRKRKSLLAL